MAKLRNRENALQYLQYATAICHICIIYRVPYQRNGQNTWFGRPSLLKVQSQERFPFHRLGKKPPGRSRVGHKYQHPLLACKSSNFLLIACNSLNAGLHDHARYTGVGYCCTRRCLPHQSPSHWHGHKTNLYRIATISCIFDVFMFLLFYGMLNAPPGVQHIASSSKRWLVAVLTTRLQDWSKTGRAL